MSAPSIETTEAAIDADTEETEFEHFVDAKKAILWAIERACDEGCYSADAVETLAAAYAKLISCGDPKDKPEVDA